MKTKSVLLGGLMCLMVFIMAACSGSVEDSEDAMLIMKFTEFENQSQVIGVNIVYKIDITDDTAGQPYMSFTANKGEEIKKKVDVGNYTISVIVFKDSIDGEVFAIGNSDGVVTVTPGENKKVPILFNLADSVPLNVSPFGGTHTVTEDPFKITLTSGMGVPINYQLIGAQSGSGTFTGGGQISVNTVGTTTLNAIARGNPPLQKDSLPVTQVYTLNTAWTVAVNSATNTTAIIFNFILPLPAGYLSAADISVPVGSGTFTKGGLTRSSDGKTWTLAITPTVAGSSAIQVNITKAGIVSGNKQVTIYGGFPLWIAVTNSTFGTSNINAIAYDGNNKFVAVGDAGKIAYSTDGITWTAVSNTTFGSYAILAVAWGAGAGKFVAVGDAGKIAYSTDGINWTATSSSVVSSAYTFTGVAWGGNKFVAIAMSFKVYSFDGITWYDANSTSSSLCIAYGAGRFVAGAGGGVLVHSANGTTWSDATNNVFAASSMIFSVAWCNNRFVAGAGGNSSEMAYSTDGMTWTATTNSTFDSTTLIMGIAWGSNRFVAVGRPLMGTGHQMAYSTNGTNWTAATNTAFGTSGINTIFWGNNKFIAAGADGKIAYSLTE